MFSTIRDTRFYSHIAIRATNNREIKSCFFFYSNICAYFILLRIHWFHFSILEDFCSATILKYFQINTLVTLSDKSFTEFLCCNIKTWNFEIDILLSIFILDNHVYLTFEMFKSRLNDMDLFCLCLHCFNVMYICTNSSWTRDYVCMYSVSRAARCRKCVGTILCGSARFKAREHLVRRMCASRTLSTRAILKSGHLSRF